MNYPSNWELKELKEVGDWHTGNTPRRSNSEYWGGSILWVSPKEMKTDRITDTEDKMTEKALEETNSQIFPEGSLIMVTRSGILEHSFPVAINDKPVTINQDLKAFVPSDSVLSEYLYYNLVAHSNDILRECSKDGTTVASINSDALYSYEVPIAPLDEQRRIVEKIEQYFSKLDAGVSELEEAEQRLDRYQGAVMQTAMEGELTEVWRSKNQPVLRNIEKSSIDVSEIDYIPQIPSSWRWVRFKSVLREKLRNGHSAKKTNEGIRTLTLTAVTERDFSEENTKITEADPEKVEDLWLESGDLLIERSNTEEYVGLPAVYRGEENYAIYPDLMIRARLDENLVIPEFADYMLLSPALRSYLRNKSKGTSGSMSKINQTHLKEMPFPLAPLDEQKKIVDRLDQITSVVSGTTENVSTELERAENLRHAILKKAFEGNLLSSTEDDIAVEEIEQSHSQSEDGDKMKQATITEVTKNAE
jgi:type I restriction enzyme S subunit